jgi:sigma-B regulation protein RsbU (phosphoserine phosphatase)
MKTTNGSSDPRHERIEETRLTGMLNVLVFLATAAVAYTDSIVVPDVSLGYLYVLPVALSALVNPLALTLALIAVCTVLQDIFSGGAPSTLQIRIVRDAMTLGGFLIVGFLVRLIARQRERLAAEVRRQRDEYEHDLTLAAQVQRQVLPKPLVCTAMELAATMQTAQLLGGDYYDFFQISENVVDVGAAASLLMPSLAVALRLRARELNGPAAILMDLDPVLRQITSTATFVTMFYGRFDQAGKTLQYANGGHNPPLLTRPKTGQSLQLDSGGPILGILKDSNFSDTVVTLEKGDILTLFTDGLTEQENDAGEEFSVARLEQVVLKQQAESASNLVGHITDAVSTFAGDKPQADDLTLVVVKIL